MKNAKAPIRSVFDSSSPDEAGQGQERIPDKGKKYTTMTFKMNKEVKKNLKLAAAVAEKTHWEIIELALKDYFIKENIK